MGIQPPVADALLQRLDESDQGTFGWFITAGLGRLYSGELPSRGNEPSISRIPTGIYQLDWGYSPHLARYCYRFRTVVGRAGVLEHSANLMGDVSKGYRAQLNGCVALGERLGWMDGQKALLLSRPAVRTVEDHFAGRSWKLEIRDPN